MLLKLVYTTDLSHLPGMTIPGRQLTVTWTNLLVFWCGSWSDLLGSNEGFAPPSGGDADEPPDEEIGLGDVHQIWQEVGYVTLRLQ